MYDEYTKSTRMFYYIHFHLVVHKPAYFSGSFTHNPLCNETDVKERGLSCQVHTYELLAQKIPL